MAVGVPERQLKMTSNRKTKLATELAAFSLLATLSIGFIPGRMSAGAASPSKLQSNPPQLKHSSESRIRAKKNERIKILRSGIMVGDRARQPLSVLINGDNTAFMY